MSLRSLFRAWEEFFFAKQSPVPIALFRIIYGLLVAVTLGLLRTDWLNWYGVRAWVSLQTALKLEPGNRLNLFTVIPQSDNWINGLFWVALGSTILLAIGLLTRINSILVLGLMFHLWLEYSLNVPLFQWDVLSAYILFVDPTHLTGVWRRMRLFILRILNCGQLRGLIT